jgi:uncharacterized protein DUF3379
MMNCLEFRRQVGAEPAADVAELVAHRRDCPACARYQDELRAMDGAISRALAIDLARLHRSAVATAPAAALPGRRRFFAIAASLVAGLAIGLVLLTVAPRASIAREVVDHIMHEPGAMAGTAPLAPGALAGVLGPEGVRLRPGIGDVTFAARCVHDGHVVPHFVVRMPEGPVTVLVLTHRDVGKPLRIEDRGLIGTVLAAPRGSIAIVGRNLADPEAVAHKVFEAVDWGK